MIWVRRTGHPPGGKLAELISERDYARKDPSWTRYPVTYARRRLIGRGVIQEGLGQLRSSVYDCHSGLALPPWISV